MKPIPPGALLAAFCVTLLFSCHKKGTSPDPTNPQTSPSADSLSDRLQFISATKNQGPIPKAPSGSSLKISFEDTLFLVDQIKMPIKFLHMDTTQNVSGVFLQVQGLIGGSFASYYYDVPELAATDSSDTVSVIMIGIDPTDLELPTSFNIVITPYNSSHQPIDSAIKPVKIVPHKTNPKGSSGKCGLVNPQDETWDWVMTYIENTFTSTPEMVYGADGQTVQGSCCAGISVYGICPGERLPNSHLHFNTFYQIAGEQLSFFDDGGFERRTVERGANPLPDSSNFCDPFEGRVSTFLNETFYSGHYIVTPETPPTKLQGFHDSLRVSLTTETTTPKGGGFGNGGGFIHYLDCGSLVLIQPDLEGFGQDIVRIYHSAIFEKWVEF